jgi:hypothetical protein
LVDKLGYTGPDPGVDARRRLKARAARYLRKRAKQIHLELVLAWAAADTGDYPTQRDADEDALEELELLLRSIGRWGLVDPDTLSWGHTSPRGYVPDWEKDLLGE